MSDDYERVNHPAHYNQIAGVECIDVVEQMTFNVGNAVKYLWRAGSKPGVSTAEDLRKAAWYVEREIQRLSVEAPGNDDRNKDVGLGDHEALVEKLAALAHSVWSSWIAYLFTSCTKIYHRGENDNRSQYILHNDVRDRWERQMHTPYEELDEEEKDSDRLIAREYLALIYDSLEE